MIKEKNNLIFGKVVETCKKNFCLVLDNGITISFSQKDWFNYELSSLKYGIFKLDKELSPKLYEGKIEKYATTEKDLKTGAYESIDLGNLTYDKRKKEWKDLVPGTFEDKGITYFEVKKVNII